MNQNYSIKQNSSFNSQPPKRKFNEVHFIIGGLIGLQVIVGFLIITLLYPARLATSGSDASFTAPPELEVAQAPLPEQVAQEMLPSDLPQIDDDVPQPINSLQDQVTFIRAQPSPIVIRGVEISQGIQVFDEPENPRCHSNPDHRDHIFCNNSMPLVSGRHTILRVYLACSEGCPTDDALVTLNVINDGEIKDTVTREISAEKLAEINGLPLEQLRLSLDRSVDFTYFPAPDWMNGQTTFDVSITVNDETPATSSTSVNFAKRKALQVAYLPIEYQGVTPQEIRDVDYWLLRLYPIPDVEYYRLPVPNLTWDRNLSKGEILQELLYVYWLYTQNHDPTSWPDQLFGWLPQEFYNGGASDPAWCADCAGPHSSRVAFGGVRPEQDIGGPRILVHEIAHNLGARHAWSPTQREDEACFKAEGADIQVDPAWPYAETPYIQEFGIDLYSDPPIIYPPSSYDMMAYCTRPWISPHTYRTIFNSDLLKPTQSSPEWDAFNPIVDGDVLLISGIIYPDGTVSRPKVVQMAQDAVTKGGLPINNRGTDYCVQIIGHNEALLAKQCFDAGFVDVETGLPTEASPYFVTMANLDVDQIAKIMITEDTSTLISITPSDSAPEVTMTYPNQGEVLSGQQTVSWEAADADNDTLLFDVLYSPDGGKQWIPIAVQIKESQLTFDASHLENSDQALIRVVANDGFHISTDEVDQTFIVTQ